MRNQRCDERRIGRARRAGFTLVELVLVILVAGLLGAIAVPQFSRYTSMRAAVNARDAFVATAAQARAAAIQLGEEIRMEVQPANGLVRVSVPRNDSTVARLDLSGGGPHTATILGNGFTVCYVPRGYARPGCTFPETIGFQSPQGTHTSFARMTIGQVERQ